MNEHRQLKMAVGADSLPGTEIDDQEQFSQLLGETARAWRLALDRRLGPLGMSQSQWLVVLHLGRAREDLSQKELANRVGIECPTLVGLLDRMEREDWIVRRPSPTDRRSKTVHLTAKAEQVRQEVETLAADLQQELLHDLSQDDIDNCRTGAAPHQGRRGKALTGTMPRQGQPERNKESS